jgi:hypothetical protein
MRFSASIIDAWPRGRSNNARVGASVMWMGGWPALVQLARGTAGGALARHLTDGGRDEDQRPRRGWRTRGLRARRPCVRGRLIDRRALRMLAAGEPFGHLLDLLLLLFDEGAKMLDRPPRVLGRDAGAVAVVAAPAGGGQVRGLPEQLRRLRARDQVVDRCCEGRSCSMIR